MGVTISIYAEKLRKRFGISGAELKTFAAICMLIDHTAAILVGRLRYATFVVTDPQTAQFIDRLYYYMRRVGRLAFPIFCFLLIEGYFHTRDVRKYAGRLFAFAIISEFPFDYALHHNQPLMTKQNVYWTLLIGLLVIWAIDYYFMGMLSVQLVIMITALFLARFLKTDYSYHGVFLIEMLYILHSYL